MPSFPSRKFHPSTASNDFAVRYRATLKKHPFLLFGLPFLTTVIAGAFFLTPTTAIRYERHDRKVTMLNEEERLGLGKGGRKVDKFSMAEEYARLAGKDLDNWENKRVKRFKGETDGILE